MKALISKLEIRKTGYRVAQVADITTISDVPDQFEWLDCPDYVIADQYWYNPINNEFVKLEYTIEELKNQSLKDQLKTKLTEIQSLLDTLQ